MNERTGHNNLKTKVKARIANKENIYPSFNYYFSGAECPCRFKAIDMLN